MPNAFTGTDAGSWDRLTETAYDREVEYALRDAPIFRGVVTKRPAAQAMPGDAVTMTIHGDFALSTTPLVETVDPDAVAAPIPSRVTVTLTEYGNPALQTLKLRALAFTKPDQELVTLIRRNMVDSIDVDVKTVLDGETNKLWRNGGNMTSAGSNGAVAATDTFLRPQAQAAVSLLRRRKALPMVGEDFVAYIHPDVAYDFMADSGTNNWWSPHQAQDVTAIWRAAVGEFMGAWYVQTPRATVTSDGVTAGKVYTTYYVGMQAIVEANAIEPSVVIGPQVDKFRRHFPIGWYGLLGWGRYREECIQLVRTASSIANL